LGLIIVGSLRLLPEGAPLCINTPKLIIKKSFFGIDLPEAENTPLVVFTRMMFFDIYVIKNNVGKGQGCHNGGKRE
jgi:hypothetical protein